MYTILMFGTAQAVLIRGVSLFQDVLISWVSLFQGCPYFRGVLISGVSLFQGYPYFRGVLISGESVFQGVLTRGIILYFHKPRTFSILKCATSDVILRQIYTVLIFFFANVLLFLGM